ncbi:Gfo/Idh/MocA family oxidoreductase [Alkalihalophilus marmarensis]|jgi:predicted dehydrogenase|uniref:Oxidoreductase n=1 Tax=Alkalihalophilus marmarensis DSM 21297 TaxID=1188261 RepID=U6SME5_9BACI|nr:Gfo/Idh/MocA family oxidoreductase [Alkalihalophilus marmarensis]ERN52864.1 hypothetical protein A33I_14370 [Alkalihalophilus marmarensis DSM 21297]MCM3489119.1 Gfo/Idh/MocA family oxidoreductase [Alkalihalophilus marmarensis]
MTLKVGLIGCGRIAAKHVDSINKCNGIEIIGLSDINQNNIEKLKKQVHKNGYLRSFLNYKDLLRHDDVELIVITSPSNTHAEIAEAALKADKHVLVEKPLSLSLDDARKLNELSLKYNKHLLVSHQLRFLRVITMLKEMINKHSFGDIYYSAVTIELNRSEDYFKEAKWRGTWELDGGMLLNQGIHLIDLMVWLMGDVDYVHGQVVKKNLIKETEDAAIGILSFRNGSKGIIQANTITQPNNLGISLKVFGEKGTVALRGDKLQIRDRWHVSNSQYNELTKQLGTEENEHVKMYEAILKLMKEGKASTSLVSGETAIQSLETILAIYKSALDSKPIQLPLLSFETTDMKSKY